MLEYLKEYEYFAIMSPILYFSAQTLEGFPLLFINVLDNFVGRSVEYMYIYWYFETS